MDALKAQLLKIQQQLGQLGASQKMLVASLVAIMVMTLFWWTRFAGTSEMVSVLGEQSLSQFDVGHIEEVLAGHGIETQVNGDKVMIPSERRFEALATLTYEDALPSAGSNPWEDMFKQMGPFDPQSKTSAMQNHAKELLLQQAIKTFPHVSGATVMIDPTSERRITNPIEPKASVLITTRGHDAEIEKLADASATAVAGSMSGLQKKNVSVVINGIPQHTSDQNNSLASDQQYKLTKSLEDENIQTITRIMPPGTVAAVHVELDTTSSQINLENFDRGKSVSLPVSSKTNDTETQDGAAQATEPGAVPNAANTALSIGAAQASSNGPNTSNQSEQQYQNFVAKSVEQTVKPAGKATVVSAAVRVPRSHYVSELMRDNPGAKQPDEKSIQALFNMELPGDREMIVNSIGLKSPDNLALTMFDDTVSAVPGMPASPDDQTNPSNMTAMIGGHMKEIAVGALAVVSLFMVSMIVKKGTPPPIAPQAPIVKETPTLAANEALAGIVGGEGGTMLDGMELGEDAVKAQHMVEQVSTLVKENPDAAANLVKRWLNRS